MDISCFKKDIWSVISKFLTARDLLAFSITNTSFRWLSIIRLTQKQTIEILYLIDTDQIAISNQTKIKISKKYNDLYYIKGSCVDKKSHIIHLREYIGYVIDEQVHFLIKNSKLQLEDDHKYRFKEGIHWSYYENNKIKHEQYKRYEVFSSVLSSTDIHHRWKTKSEKRFHKFPAVDYKTGKCNRIKDYKSHHFYKWLIKTINTKMIFGKQMVDLRTYGSEHGGSSDAYISELRFIKEICECKGYKITKHLGIHDQVYHVISW